MGRRDLHFGLFTRVPHRQGISESQAFDEYFDIVRASEELNYDTIWTGEEHFAPGLWLSASNITLASAVAMMTTRIRVGLAIVAMPLSHPLRIAEAAATVDQLSRGRLDFGGDAARTPKPIVAPTSPTQRAKNDRKRPWRSSKKPGR